MVNGIPWNWGTTEAEIARRYPADDVFSGPTAALTRAVTVQAPPELVYRWLCQVRVAPYSYDLVDNLGRRSPQHLTPGADELEIGDRMMIFELTDVQPGRQWTGVTFGRARRLFGPIAATYAVEPAESDGSRIVCRMGFEQPTGFDRLRAVLLSWGDLIMMRRQLLNLKALAERDAIAAQV